MSVSNKLLPGSYKGIRFLASSFPTTGGRKIVKHSFPNSDKQTIEDMGLLPRSYSMTLVITGDENTYKPNRDAFLQALEDGELGKLVHPLYGDVENVRVGAYTLNENLTELGEAKFTITFEISEGTGTPDQADTSLNAIETSNDATIAALNASVADNYESSTSFPNSYSESLSKLDNIGTGFTDATNIVQASADKIDEFNAELQGFISDTTDLIRAPQNLADSIRSLFNTINNLYPTVENTLTVFAGLFDFGDDDVVLTQNTASRIERAKNQKILNDTMQTMALSYSYFNASQLTFNTTDDIEIRAAELETQYQKVSTSTGMDDNSKQALRDMRVNVQTFFESQKLVTQQVITVNTELTSARLLAYQYYGSSDQGEQIADLNETSEPSFLQGVVKVLSA